MINTCRQCKAIREYPNGKKLTRCPRCASTDIAHTPSPQTQAERDAFLLKAIFGDD